MAEKRVDIKLTRNIRHDGRSWERGDIVSADEEQAFDIIRAGKGHLYKAPPKKKVGRPPAS